MRSAIVRPDAAHLSIKLERYRYANTAEMGRVHPHDESMVALARPWIYGRVGLTGDSGHQRRPQATAAQMRS
jgi:hypothetical protein